MSSKRVLVPVDLMRGTAHALVFIQQLASESPVAVTLLHVIHLDIIPQQGIYDQLRAESEAALRKLGRLFFGSDQAVRVVVRIGPPAEEIIAEARTEGAELIVLCGPKRHRARLLSRSTTEQVLEAAPCATLVLPNPAKVSRRAAPALESTPAEVCAFPNVAHRVAAT